MRYTLSHIWRFIMNGGYESLVWIRENDGKEYVCSLEDVRNPNELTPEERARCMDVNLLIGTERW
jgi:hypothetical protein